MEKKGVDSRGGGISEVKEERRKGGKTGLWSKNEREEKEEKHMRERRIWTKRGSGIGEIKRKRKEKERNKDNDENTEQKKETG